ncbi:MAG TPA: hemolysin family protein [Gemmatimonadaceae bacterium]|nr:hemolysin family protein [Gemmatimonadaceae bacterium]
MTPAAIIAAIVAAVATGIATLSAVADTATLAFDDDEEPPNTDFAERRRLHRAFALVKVLAQLTAGAAAARALGLHVEGGLARSAGLIAVLVALLLAEALGRVLGTVFRRQTTEHLAFFARWIERLFALYLAPAARLDRWLSRLLVAPPPDAEAREERSEQFREVVSEVVSSKGDVSGPGAQLLEGALSLGEMVVSDIMVPRVDILGIDVSTPWSEVLDRLRSAEHARLPAYADTLDDIRGVLYAKDTLLAAIDGTEPTGGWQSLVRPAKFVPTTKALNALLAEFRSSRTHIAIVVDEYGGTSGLVTIENILEEIVGDIRDEHDVEEPMGIRHEDGRWWVAGRASLDDLEALVGHEFESEDQATTVGGWVYEKLGRVPRPGEEFMADGFRVVVERVRRRAVDRVYFERLTPATFEI